MLTELYIENIAVIKKATINFTGGLNIFTGETGAGKTILISAINSVLGLRTSKDIIRTGEEHARVSAVFEQLDMPVFKEIMEAVGTSAEDGEAPMLIISRDIFADGRTTCKINGKTVTVGMLRSLTSNFVDIHGQHDNQQILNTEKQLEFLDNFAGNHALLNEYHKEYSAYKSILAELQELQTDESEKARMLDLLSFQIEEIELAELVENEEDDLLAQRKMFRNYEKIQTLLAQMLAILAGEDDFGGAVDMARELAQGAHSAMAFFPEFQEMAAKLEEIEYEYKDVQDTLSSTLEALEYNPAEQQYIEERLDVISTLKKKYGSSIEEIFAFYNNAKRQYEKIAFADKRVEELSKNLQKSEKEVLKKAENITKLRKKAALEFSKKVESELAFLDMPSVKLVWDFADKKLAANGADTVELKIVTNPGELPKPLAKIASGGEISRIMLAIKNVMLDKDAVATMIFDEVDTGVSGRAAQKIGRKLAELARFRQVICVTHLAQVAAFGQNHLLISKKVEKGSTFTQINTLDKPQRTAEIARILSGDNITETSLKSAEELLDFSQI